MFAPLNRYSHFAPLVLRIVVGFLFILHGLGKLGDIPGTIGMFGNMGMPVPSITAPLVGVVETFGGLALVLGLGTRIAAILLSIILIVATLFVKLPNSIDPLTSNYNYGLALLAGLIALLLLGSGAAALERQVLSSRFT